MELSWFLQPGDEQPGLLNLCYNALDRNVIAGHAEETALLTDDGRMDYATVLERVAALAGLMRGLGVGSGTSVRGEFTDPTAAALWVLAASRLGAVLHTGSGPVHLCGTDSAETLDRLRGTGEAEVLVLRDLPVDDPVHELDWGLGLKAGREEPAGCADVPGDQAALVTEDRTVRAAVLLDDPSWPARIHARLAAAEIIDLTGEHT